MEYKTIEQRKRFLLTSSHGSELVLAIEGGFTNLRIWLGDKESVYMRLDKANAYSSPLSPASVLYLNRPGVVKELAEKFGFKSSISRLDTLLELTKHMKNRELRPW